jgi:hypothetical protein
MFPDALHICTEGIVIPFSKHRRGTETGACQRHQGNEVWMDGGDDAADFHVCSRRADVRNGGNRGAPI